MIQLLLQSSGLEWFDSIADKSLSEFRLKPPSFQHDNKNMFGDSCTAHSHHLCSLSRFENDKRAVFMYGDQSIAEAMHILWQSQMGAVAVVERETKRLIGCVRNIDLHLLLDNSDHFNNRK